MKKKKKEEFVEVDVKVPPFIEERIFARWRYSDNYHAMSFEEFREKFTLVAIEERVWRDSPKRIWAATDGTAGIELI